MTKSENLYYSIQKGGIIKIESIAREILSKINANLGLPQFPNGMSSIGKIYFLIENGWYPYISRFLIEKNYNLEVELQYAISLIMNIDKYAGMNINFNPIKNFSSVESINYANGTYSFNTISGRVNVKALNKFSEDSNIKRFSLSDDFRGYCHEGARSFITYFPTYKAITSLIPNQFDEKQYHSYIELDNGYVDFANNAYFSKEDFDKIMKPNILSEVYGYELQEKISQLDEQDLPDSKSPLVRIAVHEQLQRVKK